MRPIVYETNQQSATVAWTGDDAEHVTLTDLDGTEIVPTTSEARDLARAIFALTGDDE